MPSRLFERLFPKQKPQPSYLRSVTTGSFYKISDLRTNSDISNIKSQIDTMRALARDSQISTALSYYATDATVTNSDGNIIWATPIDENSEDVSDIINELFRRWNVNAYARDHILELATIGNLYLPTTDLYKDFADENAQVNVALDNNTIPDSYFDIVPSYKIPPENVVHLYKRGKPWGYIMEPDDSKSSYIIYPETSIIHFSLGGLLGEYNIDIVDSNGDPDTYDIKFAQPLMEQAAQPTQTLGLLEDALLLSSLTKVVRFISVECGNLEEEDEVAATLQQMKDVIEQQFSINTLSGDAQSFINPQSPNNLIFMPMHDGQTPISITDLNMSDVSEAESDLLNYYQDKKLSVLGVPKEAMNFSSNEGLGGAGSVLSQRSALYANSLQRLETAYMAGWRDAINKYFIERNMSGMVDQYNLRMQPIVTQLSTVVAEKRDAAIGQAAQVIDLLKSLGITDDEPYLKSLIEVLGEEFPEMSADAMGWDVNLEEGEEGGEF